MCYLQGSCQVLKKLKGVTAKCGVSSKQKHDDDFQMPAKMKAIVFRKLYPLSLMKLLTHFIRTCSFPIKGCCVGCIIFF